MARRCPVFLPDPSGNRAAHFTVNTLYRFWFLIHVYEELVVFVPSMSRAIEESARDHQQFAEERDLLEASERDNPETRGCSRSEGGFGPNPFLEVTDLSCRLRLSILFYRLEAFRLGGR